jgi:hypothetical protein
MRPRRLRLGAPTVSAALGAAALAPLVDLLTLLVVALLRGQSADPPVVVEPGFALPLSRQERAPGRPALTIDLGQNGLYLDGWRVGAAAAALEGGGGRVEPLYAALLRAPKGPLRLRVDARVPFAAIDRLLLTAREAGYAEVELIATKASSL